MDSKNIARACMLAGMILAAALPASLPVFAHCDGVDGPVVKAAMQALETGNINAVLIWVQKKDEAEVRNAFEKTMAVRKLSPEASEMADHFFFETVVRVHRSGEGAPFTGLKPAGRDLGPAIPAADKAIEGGSPDKLLALLSEAVQNGAQRQFTEVMRKKNFKVDDVEAGREYVRAYVNFIHYIEGLYSLAQKHQVGHEHEEEMAEAHP